MWVCFVSSWSDTNYECITEVMLYSHHIKMWLTVSDVNFDPLIKGMSNRPLHCSYSTPFTFVINKYLWDSGVTHINMLITIKLSIHSFTYISMRWLPLLVNKLWSVRIVYFDIQVFPNLACVSTSPSYCLCPIDTFLSFFECLLTSGIRCSRLTLFLSCPALESASSPRWSSSI